MHDGSGEIVGELVVARREGGGRTGGNDFEKGTDHTEESLNDGDAEGGKDQDVPDGVEPEVFGEVMRAVGNISKEIEAVDHIGSS